MKEVSSAFYSHVLFPSCLVWFRFLSALHVPVVPCAAVRVISRARSSAASRRDTAGCVAPLTAWCLLDTSRHLGPLFPRTWFAMRLGMRSSHGPRLLHKPTGWALRSSADRGAVCCATFCLAMCTLRLPVPLDTHRCTTLGSCGISDATHTVVTAGEPNSESIRCWICLPT